MGNDLINPKFPYPSSILTPERLRYNVVFQKSEVNYIKSRSYFDVTVSGDVTNDSNTDYGLMINTDNNPKMLNVYIVNTLYALNDNNTASGYVHDFDQNTLTIPQSSALTSTFIHEVGHCFGLRHTFQYNERDGCPSETNIHSYDTGDMIADTPTEYFANNYDPNQDMLFNTLRDFNFSSSCEYLENYDPSCSTNSMPSWHANFLAKNFMSYVTTPSCEKGFTILQRYQMTGSNVINNISYMTFFEPCSVYPPALDM
jgi:hypothetical protein